MGEEEQESWEDVEKRARFETPVASQVFLLPQEGLPDGAGCALNRN